MTSSVESSQDAQLAADGLRDTLRVRFDRATSGDAVTRKSGRWDVDAGFQAGERIVISGPLNAGIFTVAEITDDGQTMIFDVRDVVQEIVTSALTFGHAPDEEPEVAPQGDEADTDDLRADANENASPEELTDSRDLSWLFKDSPLDSQDSFGFGARTLGTGEGEAAQLGDEQADDAIDSSPSLDDLLGYSQENGGPSAGVAEPKGPTDEDSVEARRRATHAPGRAIRSSTEVEKVMAAICDEKLAVTAYPDDGELLFASRVRAVDPDLSRIVLEYSQWKPANSALMECQQILFHCERKNRHLQFMVEAPAEIVFDGEAGIQVGFPHFVLDLQQRTDRRIRVATRPSMWCVMPQPGTDAIIAKVDDISRGGLGGIVHGPDVLLKPGTIVRDCKITGSELKRPIDVSVEVRYWKTIRSSEGELSKRVGCRFVASSADLQQLIDVFIVDLDD